MAAQHAGQAGQAGRASAGSPVAGNGAAKYGITRTPPGGWAQAWPVIMFVAVATFCVGLILLAWPQATVVVVAALIGIALLVTGIFRLIHGFTADEASGGTRAAYVIIGLLAALAGLYCLRHISVTVVLLAFIVGVFWTLHGVVDLIVAATSGAGEGRGLRALVGVLSLAAGLIVMFWPAISLTILLVVMGIWLMFYGLMLAVMAWQIRRLAT
ncbi:MAG TPA: DUF308 domain-containing protein [Streptosporangiaceae bacterium]|nr:DUF308 domain-containing protein [Streptosporangiaceae bacterium]